MQKRLDAATALVHRPPLVFLDEPTTGLDPKARNRLWDYFWRINDLGTTIFLTTQYFEEADQLCDMLAGNGSAQSSLLAVSQRFCAYPVADLDVVDTDVHA